jgi:hypothetical protein
MRTATNRDSRWLFPGRRAGQPMGPDYLAALIRGIGIPTTAGRASAIRQQVLEMPSPVVADALGYHPRYHRKAGRPGRRDLQPLRTRRPRTPVTSPQARQGKAMTASPLPAELRAAAEGLYALKAATGLIIAHGTWLGRDDFARFIRHGTGTAAIDWEPAIAALDIGALQSRPERSGCYGWRPASPTRHPSTS